MNYLGKEFATQDELFKFLVENKTSIIAQKKAATKHADAISSTPMLMIEKADVADLGDKEELKVTVVINTTNLMDSHYDVHINGIWDKSVSENKMILFLQEHKMAFDKIIADGEDLTAYVKEFTWKELGFDYEGKTQALVFEATIKRSRNKFMHGQYGKGFVKNHSVGMRYVKLTLCVNSEEEYYGAEKEAWDKYIDLVVNRKDAEEAGFFWAIKEAKCIEGSAVPKGSNIATPTLDIKSEPQKHSHTSRNDALVEAINLFNSKMFN